ncbi:MAG TPA: PLP-dependent aminotransferase family protein [bacterium]|nr:PLP-dependent aminotransferase family protein [bacterium]
MEFESLYSSTARRLQPSIIRALLKLVQDPAVISLAGGTPDSNLFDLDRYAMLAEQAARVQGRLSLQYGETAGWKPLREQVAAYLGLRGVQVSPDQVLITTGSQQGIDLLGRIFLDEGDCVALEEPAYLGAISLFKGMGAVLLALPLSDAEGLDPAAVDAALKAWTGPKPKLLYLTPTYQNPSGACLGPARRQALIELAARHNFLIIEDDPYAEISFDGPPPKPLLGYDQGGHTVFLGSFSKMSVPGLRVGFAVGPQALIQKLTVAKESADVCSSVLAQAVAAEFLAGGHLQATLPKLKSAYQARRDVLYEALQAELPAGSAMVKPAGGFFIWARLPEGFDTLASFQTAIDAKVAYVPGAVFYTRQGQGLNTVRFSFCAVEESKLREGARRLGQVLRASMAPAR